MLAADLIRSLEISEENVLRVCAVSTTTERRSRSGTRIPAIKSWYKKPHAGKKMRLRRKDRYAPYKKKDMKILQPRKV